MQERVGWSQILRKSDKNWLGFAFNPELIVECSFIFDMQYYTYFLLAKESKCRDWIICKLSSLFFVFGRCVPFRKYFNQARCCSLNILINKQQIHCTKEKSWKWMSFKDSAIVCNQSQILQYLNILLPYLPTSKPNPNPSIILLLLRPNYVFDILLHLQFRKTNKQSFEEKSKF